MESMDPIIYTVSSYKGGVGKTTTAMQLAAYLQTQGPTVLFDGDSTRNASRWAEKRPSQSPDAGPFPFAVAPVESTAKLAHRFQYVVTDTGQKPNDDDLRAIVAGCDLLIVPSVPSFLDSDGLGETIRALQRIPGANYRVLLTRVPPDAAGAAAELRRELGAAGVPMFAAEIPRLKAFEKAAGAGLIVNEVDDRNAARAWEAYASAGQELAL